MNGHNTDVQSTLWDDASHDLRSRCADLWNAVWRGKTLGDREAKYIGLREHMIHVALEDDVVVAVARTFVQPIVVGRGHRDVIALSSVCTAPDVRGRGFGDAVVRAALSHATPQMPALFQTGVQSFYERHGARTVPNEIFTSAADAEAFTDECVMIYPGQAPWDDTAAIDLTVAGW